MRERWRRQRCSLEEGISLSERVFLLLASRKRANKKTWVKNSAAGIKDLAGGC